MLLFKNIALIQLFYHVLVSMYTSDTNFLQRLVEEVDLISFVMIVAGYGISIKATTALGIDRTYFGFELGFCPPKCVFDFPYGYFTIYHCNDTSGISLL